MPTGTEPGAARSPGLSYQQLLDTDTHEVPKVLRLESSKFFGDADVSIDRYISREWHEREKERLWSRVWQFACREEHIPEVGDHTLYEIAGKSYIVMRSGPDEIKAFPNACLHRGRQLKQYDGRCSEIRCPFHGFAWNVDGSLKDVPAQWDLPHVTEEAFHLPELRVGTWAGFVFVNPDPNAEPLEDFIGELADQFERVGPRQPVRAGPRGQGDPGQLEDRPGGLLRGVPRERHPPADPALHRRHQQPGRRVGQLRPGDHAGGHAEPADRLGARRRDDHALRPRRAGRRGRLRHRPARPDRPLGHGRRHARPLAAGRR